jgi:hypothetical protein
MPESRLQRTREAYQPTPDIPSLREGDVCEVAPELRYLFKGASTITIGQVVTSSIGPLEPLEPSDDHLWGV